MLPVLPVAVPHGLCLLHLAVLRHLALVRFALLLWWPHVSAAVLASVADARCESPCTLHGWGAHG